MSSLNVKTLAFADLEKEPEKGPVWVLNGTQNEHDDKRRRQLMLVVPSPNGNTYDTIIIPRTFIPINLTEQVSKKQLVQSSDFRKAVARELILLIDEESANSVLSRRDAITERERLRKEAMKVRELLDTNMAVVAEGEGTSATNNSENTQLIRDISPAVMQVMADTKGRQQIEIKNSLQNIGNLTQKDFEYVLSSSSEQGLSKLAQWAEKKIQKFAKAASSEEDNDLELEE